MYDYVTLACWAFLPGIIISVVQAVYYALTVRDSATKPAAGSAQHKRHRDTITVILATAFLLYTVVQTHHELRSTPNLFAELGVPATASEREIRARFRRIAAQHHPDKAGAFSPEGADDSDSSAAAADFFVHLQTASKTLQDGTSRFVYERFGPDALAWDSCTTAWDYVCRGILYDVLPYYGGAVAFVVIGAASSFVFGGGAGGGGGGGRSGYSYRWMLLLAMCLAELYAVTRGPALPAPLALLNRAVGLVGLPPYLPFEVTQFARRVGLTTYLAASQIVPVLLGWLGCGDADGSGSPATTTTTTTTAAAAAKSKARGGDKARLLAQLARLESDARELDAEAARAVDQELAPFADDARVLGRLQGRMREWLVNNTVHADPVVRDALGSSIRRTRVRHGRTSK